MYHVDKREHKHRKFWKRTAWFVAIVLFGVTAYLLLNLRISPQQQLRNAAPISKPYDATTAQKVPIDKPELHLELPQGWKEVKLTPTDQAPRYVFASPSSQAQRIEIYIDNPPARLAINRAISVSSEAGSVVHESVSDNCTTYTDASPSNVDGGSAHAKWQGIDFYCDVANYARAVVGTVSKDGINFFNVTGAKTGTHKVFITYTDNSISPDYSTLYEILNSMQFK